MCGKPLALTRTTTTELLDDGGIGFGRSHPVQSVIHCEDGHQAVLPPGFAAGSAVARLRWGALTFTVPPPRDKPNPIEPEGT